VGSSRYETVVKPWRNKNGRWYRPVEYAKRRCTDKNHREYPGYGGRGIRCTLTYDQAHFLYNRDRGEILERPSLDRVDPDGNYTFENCRYIELTENIKRRRPRGSIQHATPENQKELEWEE